MPIQSVNEFTDDPDDIGSPTCSQMESSRSTRAMTRRKNISPKTLQENFLLEAEGAVTFDCMFCNESFKYNEELGKHVLTNHRPTLCEPTVLRVEAQYLSPQEKGQKESQVKDITDNYEGSDCEVCGQNFHDSSDLETHMKIHKDSFTYSCDICGRRFKEPWFLKNHKRTHFNRSGAKNKPQPTCEEPVTINDAVQEQLSRNVTSYKMCMVCGFFFPDKDTLLVHSKIHIKASSAPEKPTNSSISPMEATVDKASGKVCKEEFMNFLNLKPSVPTTKTETPHKWIPELDPVNTYQAWQLATKGKVARCHDQLKEPHVKVNMETDSSDKEEINDFCSAENASQPAHADVSDPVKAAMDAKVPASSHDPDNPKKHCSKIPSAKDASKFSNLKIKSTLCNDCGKSFKNFQQLSMHSRVHRRGRSDSESSTVSSTCEGRMPMGSPDPPTSLEDHDTNKMQDDSESDGTGGEAVLTDKNEDGEALLKTKGPPVSRECGYCGKTFRSNYYLNIHLRTHTGEKPYNCEFCDYAAAQKTSLRYHLERHHKFKPGESNARVKSISKNVQIKKSPSPPLNGNELERKSPQEAINDTKPECFTVKPPKRLSALRNKLVHAKQLLKSQAMVNVKTKPENAEPEEEKATLSVQHVLIEEVSLACEESLDQETFAIEENSSLEPKKDFTIYTSDSVMEDDTKPLDLCIKPAETLTDFCDSALLVTHTCPYCNYKTLYPEVFRIHQKLAHKQNCELTNNGSRNKSPGYITKVRRTGCPPALKGVDVSPVNSDNTRQKISSQLHPKALNNDKPKLSAALSRKGGNSLPDYKFVEHENKPHSVHLNIPQVRRYMQPDLQGITHLLHRMQDPEHNVAPWKPLPSSLHNSITNGYRTDENQFTRPVSTQLEIGEPVPKMAKHNIVMSASTNFSNADMVKRLLNQPYTHNQGDSSTNSGQSLFPTNIPQQHDVGHRNIITQASTSAMEVQHVPLYRRLSKRALDAMHTP